MNKVKQYIWNKDEPLIIMAKAELLLSETHSNVENLGYVYIKKNDIIQVIHEKEENKVYVRIYQDEGMLEKQLNEDELKGLKIKEFELKEYKDYFKNQTHRINRLIHSWIKDMEYKKLRRENDAKILARQMQQRNIWTKFSL